MEPRSLAQCWADIERVDALTATDARRTWAHRLCRALALFRSTCEPLEATLLAHRDNKDRFVIKASYKAFFAASVQYVDLDRDGAVRLKAALDDALQAMQ
jgi:hypothetical protein